MVGRRLFTKRSARVTPLRLLLFLSVLLSLAILPGGARPAHAASGPDLGITDLAGQALYVVGDTVTYTLTITNAGSAGSILSGTAVTATDSVPLGLANVAVSSTPVGSWSFTNTSTTSPSAINATYTGTYPITPGETLPTITVTGIAVAAGVGNFHSGSSVTVPGDTNPLNNSATASVFISAIGPASTATPTATVTITSTATMIPATSTVTPTTIPVATATAVPTPPTLVIHNTPRTVVGGRTTACDLAGNSNGLTEAGCEVVSSISGPGASVTYTLTYSDGTTQTSVDTADRGGQSLHPFSVAYVPPTARQPVGISVSAVLADGTHLGPVTTRFAVMNSTL